MRSTVGDCVAELQQFWVCYQLEGQLNELAGKREEAIASLTRAVALSKGFAPAHAWLGRSLAVAGRSEEAIDQLETAMSLSNCIFA